MAFRAIAGRIFRVAVLCVLALVVIAIAFVQTQQHLLRYRAARLLADFHSIRLNQSTWADAQTLITRWGAFGHYNNTCNSTECGYSITLADLYESGFLSTHSDRWNQALSNMYPVYSRSGGKAALVSMNFLVQDGIVLRSSFAVRVDVEPTKSQPYAYGLGVSARASDVLHQVGKGPWVLGNEEQLAQHPDYKVGKPGGCEGCADAEITFTPYLSPPALAALTNFDLSCLTRYSHPCRNPADLLPSLGNYHFYEPLHDRPPIEAKVPTGGLPCDIPVRAVARDADVIFSATALSRSFGVDKSYGNIPNGMPVERATMDITQLLKGSLASKVGSTVEVVPFSGDPWRPNEDLEHLLPGKDYLVFLQFDKEHLPLLDPERCGVQEDSPAVRAQVRQGIAQLLPIRRHENFGATFR